MKIVMLMLLVYFLILIAVMVSKLQDINNYDRCVSVISTAINTHKLPKNINAQDKCQKYLE